MMPVNFTETDKLDAARRELKYRRHVYQRRVDQGAMSPQEAKWQIGVMEAIVDDYEKRAQRERLI